MTGTLAAPLLLPLFRRYRTLQFVRSDNDPEFTVNDFNQFIRSADMTYGGRLQHGVEIGGGPFLNPRTDAAALLRPPDTLPDHRPLLMRKFVSFHRQHPCRNHPFKRVIQAP